jgi:hypothetical protein
MIPWSLLRLAQKSAKGASERKQVRIPQTYTGRELLSIGDERFLHAILLICNSVLFGGRRRTICDAEILQSTKALASVLFYVET